MAVSTPIAFFVFNRPQLTRRVFARIAEQRPRHLLLISDGPRTDRPDDKANVQQCREIAHRVDWPCELHTKFSTRNLGCRDSIASGISWAFEKFDSLIILEDDCLPSPSFFGFCECLLDRYRAVDEIMMISGNNFQPEPRSAASYYFSRWTHIWGWATWRRAWKYFDPDIVQWPEIRDAGTLSQVFQQKCEYDFWCREFDRIHAGEIDTWDYQWALAVWQRLGKTILPNQNLVSNLGFGSDATHTTDDSPLSELKTFDIPSLIHPDHDQIDDAADRWTSENIFNIKPQRDKERRGPWWTRWPWSRTGRRKRLC